MKRKIFKIICIAVVSLLSLAILVGAFMVAIITPKNETISASADTTDNSNLTSAVVTSTSEPPVLSENYLFGGLYYVDFSVDENRNGPEIFSQLSTTFTFPIMVGGYLFTSLTFRNASSSMLKLGYIIGTQSDGTTVTFYRAGRWSTDFVKYWCLLPGDYTSNMVNSNYGSEFTNFLYTCAKPCLVQQNYDKLYNYAFSDGHADGYQEGFHAGYTAGGYDTGYNTGYHEGYDVGYEDGVPVGYDTGFTAGYSDGHLDGLNLGHSDRITNPISSFIEPVHSFMNTPFFGTLTYATIFNIVLFVAVAVIFIKMFSGG